MFVQRCSFVQKDHPAVPVIRELGHTIVPNCNPHMWTETDADVGLKGDRAKLSYSLTLHQVLFRAYESHIMEGIHSWT